MKELKSWKFLYLLQIQMSAKMRKSNSIAYTNDKLAEWWIQVFAKDNCQAGAHPAPAFGLSQEILGNKRLCSYWASKRSLLGAGRGGQEKNVINEIFLPIML